jgi:hypothetical protein
VTMCMPLAYIHSEADGDADAMGEVAGEAEGDGDSDSEAEGDGVAEADSEAEQGHGMVPCGVVGSVECQPLRHASKGGKMHRAYVPGEGAIPEPDSDGDAAAMQTESHAFWKSSGNKKRHQATGMTRCLMGEICGDPFFGRRSPMVMGLEHLRSP